MSLNLLTTRDCTPSDCVEGMQPKRFERQHHVAKMIHGVVDILSHFHVTFAAARQLVVEGMSQPGELFLRNQVMRRVPHVPDGPMIEMVPHHRCRR